MAGDDIATPAAAPPGGLSSNAFARADFTGNFAALRTPLSMLPLRRRWAALALGLVAVTSGRAAADAVPPVAGELAGEFTPLTFPGAPTVNWKLALRHAAPDRIADLTVTGPGIALRAEVRFEPAGSIAWRVREGQVDLALWFAALAPHAGAEFATMGLSGAVSVEGAGTWRDGVVGGRAKIAVHGGRIDDPAHKLLLEGLSFEIEIADLAAPRTAPAQRLTWTKGKYDVIELGKGVVEFALDGGTLRVNEAAIDIFGGELQVGSLEMSTQRPEFAVEARMSGVEVGQILFLLPPVLSEAHGRLDGQVTLRRDATGVQIGNGRLALRQGETADLRLAVKPGWLSTSLPPDVLKYFPGFRKIESGEIPIRARVLEITLTPSGDAAGRTAWVHLAGGPSDPALTAPIDTQINVRGPLEALVKLGADLSTNPRLRFGGAK